jgi:hypothetical protein
MHSKDDEGRGDERLSNHVFSGETSGLKTECNATILVFSSSALLGLLTISQLAMRTLASGLGDLLDRERKPQLESGKERHLVCRFFVEAVVPASECQCSVTGH